MIVGETVTSIGYSAFSDCKALTQVDFGDNLKQITAYEGSVDLFSRSKDGAGWVDLIVQTLIDHCEGAWRLNSHQYERENGIFHWEWVFQVEG